MIRVLISVDPAGDEEDPLQDQEYGDQDPAGDDVDQGAAASGYHSSMILILICRKIY